MVDLLCSLESNNDMQHKKHGHKRKARHSVLTDCQEQRKTARKLGYKSVEEYEQGLSTIKRLLAAKAKEKK